MDSAFMGGDVFEEMCKGGSGGEEEGKGRKHATGDGFGSLHGLKSKR